MLIWHGKKILKKLANDSNRIMTCLANTVAEKAKALVPVKSGQLKSTIHATANEVIAGSSIVTYAGKVELGTDKQAAQPYLRPAGEQLTKNDLDQCIT